ncbi:MAG TPA: hypothetical protein PLT33_12905 [Deltaproteobacteria bacterium]|nr:MAG: hypothetical protein BWX71_00776 [Deltaproteobacteria bacterium ADurb.Bin072]HNQ86740.1 hypothetical protein [Deltaproteobacteria bacterium]HNS90889.1 hypothetical protein [Deltaproteobacteria bacterium]HOI08671.1 hypothetical protein [Deltaproteobacteria bacterium]HPA76792.1 hypothetical protein [Deltaproteobacteria bacterium]
MMDYHKARILHSLRKNEPEAAETILEILMELREAARDRFETATTDTERLSAQVESRLFRDLLSLFDNATAVVQAEEQRRSVITTGLDRDKRMPSIGSPY